MMELVKMGWGFLILGIAAFIVGIPPVVAGIVLGGGVVCGVLAAMVKDLKS